MHLKQAASNKTLRLLFRATAIVVVLTVATSASAAVVAYEGFDYAAGLPVSGLVGGTGWSLPWENPSAQSATVADSELYYGTLLVTGLAGDSTGAETTLNFRSFGAVGSGEMWFSFLARAEDASAAGTFFGLTAYNGGYTTNTHDVFAMSRRPGTAWGVDIGSALGGTDGALADPVVVGETYFLVGHLVMDVLGPDSFSLFVNPTPGGPTPAVPDSTGTAEYLSFDRLRIAAQSGRNWLFDEIRIGSSYADVAPAIPVDTDFNETNGTDMADFHILRTNYLTGTVHAQGDANGDRIVNQTDFFLWRTEFLASGASLPEDFSFVPEPSTTASVIALLLAVAMLRRRMHTAG